MENGDFLQEIDSSAEESSSSPDLQIEVIHLFLNVTPLLKPVGRSISSGFDLKWYFINVSSVSRRKMRYYINLTRCPNQLPKVLLNTLKYANHPKWTAIFLSTAPQDFYYYKSLFPMVSIATGMPTDRTRNFIKQECTLKRPRALRFNAKKIKQHSLQFDNKNLVT
ncbi:uncharacterized protein LOC108096242 [Drosophila ficusphila]|uniref:uncharacterized protein LOC108096242 n=1 Tax=Drosophila ficusphila TaxID=30025 RepID=UPI0007E5F9E2|nr:uncharacterized protein LOC108096242 [Drosophila ficusphila]